MRKVFWLFVFLFLASVAWHYSLQNHSDLAREIEKYASKIGGRVDISPILEKYLSVGMGKDEVLSFFKGADFDLWPTSNQEAEQMAQFDEVYVAHFSAPIFLPMIPAYKVYKFILFFKDGRLVKYEGKTYSEP